MNTYSNDLLADWLSQLNLERYYQMFVDQDVTLDLMPDLTAEDLSELGVKSIGHRRRLLTAAQAIADLERAVPATKAGATPDTNNIDPATTDGAEQRVITAMFCDLVGSTRLSTLVDPEEYRDLIAKFRQLISGTLLRYNGHVVRFLGDGIVVFFGLTGEQEHSAENAVAAAVDIIQQVITENKTLGQNAQVRIGIATGLTIVNSNAADQGKIQADDTIVGEVPNLAARLQASTDPNTILVSQSTRDRLGHLFQFEDSGLLTLKGISGGVQAWRVIDHNESDNRFDAFRSLAPTTDFVGRRTEMATLLGTARKASQGSGHVSLITGEPGMGKSRLARELLVRTGKTLSLQLMLQCTPYHSGTPFLPMRRLITRLLDSMDPNAPPNGEINYDIIEEFLKSFGISDETQVELLVGFLSQPSDLKLSAQQALEDRHDQIAMLTDLLCAMARDAGTIVLEDIQWMDASTTEVLARVAEDLADLSVHLLCTMRPGHVPDWCQQAHANVLTLDRLPAADFNELVRSVAQVNAPNLLLSDAQIAKIAIRCDGSPVFAEELTRFAVDHLVDHSRFSEAPLPATLADSLLSRLDRLDTGRQLAQLAAVIGNEFPVEILISISDLPKPEVLRGVDALIDAGVFQRGHSLRGTAIGFRHMLLRDAAYLTLLRRDRILVHAKIADILMRSFPDMSATLPQVVAYHLSEGGNIEDAVTFWDRAGTLASERSAYSEAIVHFRSALDKCTTAPAGLDLEEAELMVRLNLVAALIPAYGFNSPEVHAEMPRVEALGAALDSPGQMLPLLVSKWVYSGGSGKYHASLEIAGQIKALAVNEGEIGELLTHRCLGTAHFFCGNLSEAKQALEAFFEIYDPQKHDAGLGRFGSSHHATMSAVGLAEMAILACDDSGAEYWSDMALRLVEISGQPHDMCHYTIFIGCIFPMFLKQYDVVWVNVEKLKKIASDHNLEAWTAYAELFESCVMIQNGKLDEGCALARSAISRVKNMSGFLDFCLIFHAEACVNSGLIAEARASFDAIGDFLQDDTWLSAEFARICNYISFHEGQAKDVILASYDRASELAGQQGAKLFQRKIAECRSAVVMAKGNF